MNYPGNSKKNKSENPEERKKLERVTSSDPVLRKKSLGKKVAETFAGDDARAVGATVLFEVVIPAIKNLIFEAGSRGLEQSLFGTSSSSGGGARRVSGSRISYNTMYKSGTKDSGPRELSRRARVSHDFDEIILPSRGEAEVILERMSDAIEAYGVVTVSELYDLVGITGNFTDDKWGWDDLRASGVRPVRNGYLLNLPKPEPID